MWRFPGKTFILLPIILWNIDVRNYGGSKSVCWVWKTYRYVDTKNTFLLHWGANIWLATLQWWPLWILSSGGKRTRRNSGDFKYVTQVVHGPDRVTVHPPPPRTVWDQVFFCSLDLPRYQKSMPSKKSWDELPVLGHFQNGRHRNLEISFCAITWVLRQLESQNWCLCICFWGWRIQFCQ